MASKFLQLKYGAPLAGAGWPMSLFSPGSPYFCSFVPNCTKSPGTGSAWDSLETPGIRNSRSTISLCHGICKSKCDFDEITRSHVCRNQIVVG